MKILVVNTYDKGGGAARAAWRLYRGLLLYGPGADMLVQIKRRAEEHIHTLLPSYLKPVSYLMPYFDFVRPFLQIRKRIIFSPSQVTLNPVRRINDYQADVVHLNWITGGFMKIEALKEIQAPLVWTLHDMWPFTGGCHYTQGCEKYKEGCGCCPILRSHKQNDLSRKIFLRKLATYRQIKNLTFITASAWMADMARQSPVMENRRVEVIPIPLNALIFAPKDKQVARRHFDLPPHKKIILFGAYRCDMNEMKGMYLLLEAWQQIRDENMELIIFGNVRKNEEIAVKYHVRFLGHIKSDQKLSELYSAADVMIVPSLQESFGQTVTEAFACGTPVVAFASTGLLDLVKHEYNGYQAQPFDIADLARGIQWIFADKSRQERLSQNARKDVVENYDLKPVTQRIISLYNEILK